MDPDNTTLIWLAILVAFSALFSGSETALFSLTPAKVESLVANKIKGAKLIKYFKSNPQKMLVLLLLGNNVVNTASAAVATVYFTNLFQSYGAGIATGVMTLILLVFGEVLPKSFAAKHSLKVSQLVIYPLVFIEKILFPIVWVFEKGLSKLIGRHIHSVSEDEVIAMVSMGAEEGSIEKHEKEFIENVLEFNDIYAEDIMTPRTEIDGLPSTTTIREAIKFAAETNHSRIPVFTEDLDGITGFITAKKLLNYGMDPRMSDKTLADVELYEFIKIPTTRKIYSLFLEFKRKRTHIALVFDEHGGIEGIVTMEDILEEIVGEITDETDFDEVETIRINDDKTLTLQGDAEIGDIERLLDVEITNYDNVDQINWVILDHLKRFPKKDEAIIIGNTKFVVTHMDADSGKIISLKAEKLKAVG